MRHSPSESDGECRIFAWGVTLRASASSLLSTTRQEQGDERMDPGRNGAARAIDVAALRKTYRGGVEAGKGISFDVARGEVFGLLGPNGAGKSTTIGMLTTTVAPTAGRAQVAGFDVVDDPIGARAA